MCPRTKAERKRLKEKLHLFSLPKKETRAEKLKRINAKREGERELLKRIFGEETVTPIKQSFTTGFIYAPYIPIYRTAP